MMSRMKIALVSLLLLVSAPLFAATLSDIKVANGDSQATITLNFSGQPVYGYFPLRNPDRVVIDVRQSGMVQGNNMKLCETLQLSPGKYLQIVKVGKKYYLIGSAKDSVSFMTELDEDMEFADRELPGFSDILEKLKKKKEEDE